MVDGVLLADFWRGMRATIWWILRRQCDIRLYIQVHPRTIPAEAGISQPWAALPPKLTPPLAAHDCEIPASAGMVQWETGDCWRILTLLSPMANRFLLPQEWSGGGMGNCGWILALLSPVAIVAIACRRIIVLPVAALLPPPNWHPSLLSPNCPPRRRR